MTTLSVILVVVLILVWLALNSAHRDETGINIPSRRAMRSLRKRARKQGISEERAYENWLTRKQQKLTKHKDRKNIQRKISSGRRFPRKILEIDFTKDKLKEFSSLELKWSEDKTYFTISADEFEYHLVTHFLSDLKRKHLELKK